VNYRESFDMFCTSGISFNHESYLRNESFIIKKILNTAFDILDGNKEILELGNIDIKRDFLMLRIRLETFPYLMVG